TASQASPLWRSFPEDALLALGVCVDVPALTEALGEFLPSDVRKSIRMMADRGAGAALGKDVATEILPFLGPEYGFCITAPARTDKAWFPQMTSALRVHPGGNGTPL